MAQGLCDCFVVVVVTIIQLSKNLVFGF